MAHQRKAIRDAAIAALEAAEIVAAGRVFATRMSPVNKSELPCLSVYTTDETVDPDSAQSAPRRLVRDLELRVVAWAEVDDNLDDTLDALAADIEDVFEADRFLASTCRTSYLADTQIGIAPVGTREVGMVELTFAVEYETEYVAPDADFIPFEGAEAEWNLGNAQHADDRAQDTIDVETE